MSTTSNITISEKLSDILIKLGYKLKNDPEFILEIEKILNSNLTVTDQSNKNIPKIKVKKVSTKSLQNTPVINSKIEEFDLYSLAESKTDDELINLLFTFSVPELKMVLKKYHFGISPKQKTASLMVPFIVDQVRKRTKDVFRNI